MCENQEETYMCSHCNTILDKAAFPPSAARNHAKRCTTCGNKETKERRKKEPLLVILRTIKDRERRLQSACDIKHVSEVTSVFQLYNYQCLATGKVLDALDLTLIRLENDKPLSVTNAVPVHRAFARHHPVLPEIFKKNIERFKTSRGASPP